MGKNISTTPDLNLADLIDKIRDELVESEERRQADGKEPFFRLDSMELELQFVVRKEAQASGGWKLSVLTMVEGEISGGGSVESKNVQTIRLKFNGPPVGPMVNRSDPLGTHPLIK